MYEKFQRLRVAYGAGLPRRIAEIRECWTEIRCGRGDLTDREAFHRLVHNIAGSAGTFGFGELGERAQELEQLLLPQEMHLPTGFHSEIEDRLAVMQLLAQRQDNAGQPVEPAPVHGSTEENRLVYVIEDDVELALKIQEQLARFGWEVRLYHGAADAGVALRDGPLPAGVVVDLCLAEGRLAGAIMMQEVNAVLRTPVPVVVISVNWDWESRLEAARAGADAYIVKPVDFGVLADRLDAVTRRQPLLPYRVLIVEDTALLAEHYSDVLRSAGMEVLTVSDPAHLTEVLATFDPSLILMDLYLPSCSGAEAARVIRQDRKYASVPIVFLSTESMRRLQLAALQIGADEFLQKPISDAELVTAVTTRAERFRELAALIRQDGMTGLFNPISFKLSLESEIERSRRAGSKVTLAMIDIDGFKQVNDTNGHPVGDRVILALTALLRRRLRKSDLPGRYGGDEFVVMMPDTDAADAMHALEVLRAQFAGIGHVGAAGMFHCTFSAGVAALPPARDAESLIKAADAALYEAKRAGRNCIRAQ